MKMTEYRKLKKEVESRYQQALDRAENDRMEALAAIDTVWNITNPRRQKTTDGAVSVPSQYGSLVETVRKAIDLVPRHFTKNHVIAAMKQIAPDMAKTLNPNSLAGCIHRLNKEGAIVQVKKGKGSSPAEYEKATNIEDAKEQQTIE